MIPTLNMVKFFTQTRAQACPMCLAGMDCPPGTSKCLCVVKGRMVPARGYVEDRDKNPEDEEPKEPKPATSRPTKTEEERFFTEIAKKYLEDLKKEEEQRKKKPEED